MKVISKHLKVIIAGIVMAVIVMGMIIIYEITEENKLRVINEWRKNLTEIVEVRADKIEIALAMRFTQLSELVDNASLGLYLTSYKNHRIDSGSIDAMQGHVVNLLQLSNRRLVIDNKTALPAKEGLGIVVLGLDNRVLVSTEGLNVEIDNHIKTIEKAYASGEVQIIDLFIGKGNTLIYGLVAPVLKFQNIGSKAYVGVVMQFLNPQNGLMSVLKASPHVEKSFESLLIASHDGQLVYINTLEKNAGAFKQAPDRPLLASAYATRYPGMTKILTDYHNDEVLVAARKINNSPWWLVQKISIAEILSTENKIQTYVFALFLMSVLIVVLLSRQFLAGAKKHHRYSAQDEKAAAMESCFNERNKGVINALVKAADAHDPYCENHSKNTRDVAMAIACEMGLTRSQLASLEVAAILANIGKMSVPKKILIKKQPLTQGESRRLKKHVEMAVDMLSGVEFEGPVLDIIAQKNECLDGSGYPKGLVSDEIIIESRILSVANSFVAMVSARAYRDGLKINNVLEELLAKSETRYDKQVVTALIHVCENKTDLNAWLVI